MKPFGFPCGSAVKESACNAADLGSVPGLGGSPGEGKGYPLQYRGGEFHGLYGPWGRQETDTAEQLSLTGFLWGKLVGILSHCSWKQIEVSPRHPPGSRNEANIFQLNINSLQSKYSSGLNSQRALCQSSPKLAMKACGGSGVGSPWCRDDQTCDLESWHHLARPQQ